MDTLEAMRGRASTRAFVDRTPSRETLTAVLEAARWAPSGVNTQPWQVVVAGRSVLQQVGEAIVAARESGEAPSPDYQYYPDEFPEPYLSRRRACGYALYNALGIRRDDRQRRKEQWYRNYEGFGAPIELFVFIDRRLAQGSWVDLGMFIQNIMLAARAFDLETCPQASMAEYPDLVRKRLDVPRELALVCGIAVGYPDPDHPINQYRTEREPVDSFTRWVGVPET